MAVRLSDEDQARANFYALLARLYADAPDAALLSRLAAADEIVGADGGATELSKSWTALTAAASVVPASAAAQEYTDLFVGVGKSEVNLHASHYVAGFMMEKPLAALRGRLAELGIARRSDHSLVEDHLASLLEIMRMLVGGHGAFPPQSLDVQKVFFEAEVAPWFEGCCTAIQACAIANLYRTVAEFTRQFLRLESEAFRIG